MSTIGFAVKQNGSINVKTVSSTQQAAKINWLVVECSMHIYQRDAAEGIEAAFNHLAAERNASCIQVEILEIAP